MKPQKVHLTDIEWASIQQTDFCSGLPLFINSPFLTFNWCLICSGCSPPPGGIRFMRKFKTLVRKPLNKRRRQEKTGVYQIILNVPLLTYIRFSKLSKKNGWAHTWAGLLKIQIHTYANISKGNKALKKKRKRKSAYRALSKYSRPGFTKKSLIQPLFKLSTRRLTPV